MGQFKGKAENIENNLNKVSSINAARTNLEYPSAKAVFDFAKTDETYNPESEKPQSGKAVAQAISHFDTILKSGNTFVFDGGRPSGKINIDSVVDSVMDPQSKNPVQNDTLVAEFKKIDKNISLAENRSLNNEEAIENIQESIEEKMLFMAMHPVGSLYWSGQNVNPAETYGGEWELVDKEFKPLSYVNNNYTDITDGLVIQPSDKEFASTVYQVQCVRNGHQATLQVAFTTTKEITADKNADLFVVNFDEIGARRIIYYWRNTIAFSDNLNYQNGVYCDVYYSDGSDNNMGVVYTTETIRAEKISSGTGLIIRLDFQFEPFCIDADGNRVDVMLDSACDKFCWKRVA